MNKKIVALFFVAVTAGVFVVARFKTAPPSDLRDAVKSDEEMKGEEFNTGTSAIVEGTEVAIEAVNSVPAPEVVSVKNPEQRDMPALDYKSLEAMFINGAAPVAEELPGTYIGASYSDDNIVSTATVMEVSRGKGKGFVLSIDYNVDKLEEYSGKNVKAKLTDKDIAAYRHDDNSKSWAYQVRKSGKFIVARCIYRTSVARAESYSYSGTLLEEQFLKNVFVYSLFYKNRPE